MTPQNLTRRARWLEQKGHKNSQSLNIDSSKKGRNKYGDSTFKKTERKIKRVMLLTYSWRRASDHHNSKREYWFRLAKLKLIALIIMTLIGLRGSQNKEENWKPLCEMYESRFRIHAQTNRPLKVIESHASKTIKRCFYTCDNDGEQEKFK